ncbi:3'-5'-exodeoxyribonuclease [Elysia marginata]|uniref:3'-5'-exodeoxyribonuclease n=1 Tax=Elysia marginata TaxID=1093978 RepID=A0AAV4IJY9_9GAST|nr:3'-5'-exodeoxyribonuclease [Elysia marginata]
MEVESTQVEGDQEVVVIEQEGGAEEVSGGTGQRQSKVEPGFDAHFHLDRMGKRKAKGGKKVTLGQVLGSKGSSRVPVELKEGCVVFCDPSSYPSERDLKEITDTPGFKVAVGIHPKGAQGVGETVVTQFRKLVENPRVAAVGEVGLDFTVEGTLQQEWVLQKCLQAASRGPLLRKEGNVVAARMLVTSPEVGSTLYFTSLSGGGDGVEEDDYGHWFIIRCNTNSTNISNIISHQRQR